MNIQGLFDAIRKLEDMACTCDVMNGWGCDAGRVANDVRDKIGELMKALGVKRRYE